MVPLEKKVASLAQDEDGWGPTKTHAIGNVILELELKMTRANDVDSERMLLVLLHCLSLCILVFLVNHFGGGWLVGGSSGTRYRKEAGIRSLSVVL